MKTTEIDSVRARNLRVGDVVTAVYDPKASRRQPAGSRSGDRVLTGAFRSVPEHTVAEIARDDKETTVLARVKGASVSTWQAPVSNDTLFEILREVEI